MILEFLSIITDALEFILGGLISFSGGVEVSSSSFFISIVSESMSSHKEYVLKEIKKINIKTVTLKIILFIQTSISFITSCYNIMQFYKKI